MRAPTPRYLLDTNIVLHYLRRNALGQHVENTYSILTSPTVPLISIVTEGELRSLALQLGWGASRVRQLDHIVAHLVTVPLDHGGIIQAYAEIDDFSRRSGQSMGKNDVWIAATARVTGARLITTDQDFDHLDPQHLSRDYIDPASFP